VKNYVLLPFARRYEGQHKRLIELTDERNHPAGGNEVEVEEKEKLKLQNREKPTDTHGKDKSGLAYHHGLPCENGLG